MVWLAVTRNSSRMSFVARPAGSAGVIASGRAFRPKMLYRYHFGRTDTGKLVKLLRSEPGIEVGVRKME